MSQKKTISSPSELAGYIHLSKTRGRIVISALCILALGLLSWCFFGTMTDKEYIKGVVFPINGTDGVSVPNAGMVKEVFVHKGDKVEAGQSLALVSISGTYSIVSSPYDGIVLSNLSENESFEAFEDIFNLLPSDIDQENFVTSVTAFANFKSKRFLAPGQIAQITPANETRERIGYVRGRVVSVSAYPVTKREAILKLQNASLADEIFPDDASVFQVEIEMDTNPRNGNELDWSFLSKEKVDMGVGTFCNIEVITRSRNVFHYMLENVSEAGHSVELWVKE